MQRSQFFFIFVANLYWIISNITMADMLNFKLEEFQKCGEHKLSLFVNPKNFNPGLQLVDVNMSLSMPLGKDATAKVLFEVDTKLGNNQFWIYLFYMEGEYLKMLNQYMGELWYDIERGMGIMPRICPIPRGNYHGVNLLLNYEKLKLQTFPFGKIRITIRVSVAAHPDVDQCYKFIVSHSD